MTIQEVKDLIIFAKDNNISKLSFDGMSVEFDILIRAQTQNNPVAALASVPREELLAAFKAAHEDAAVDENWSAAP